MSNYPPGVTGYEWQIAGPEYEIESDEWRTVSHDCDEERFEEGFEGDLKVTITRFGRGYLNRVDWVCPVCGTAVEDEEDEPDDWCD